MTIPHTLLWKACPLALALPVLLAVSGCADPWEEARAYSREDLPCASDKDCCVVFEPCMATGLLVGIADRDKVRELLDSASSDDCLLCKAPSVQVSCDQGRCAAAKITGNTGSSELRQDHCGTLAEPVPAAGAGQEEPLSLQRQSYAITEFHCN